MGQPPYPRPAGSKSGVSHLRNLSYILFHREDFLENRSGLVTVHTEGVSDILFALVERLGGHLGFAHSHLVLHH